jgi:cephalosporin-C deacetylase
MNYNDMPLEELRKYNPSLTARPDFEDFWGKTVSTSKEQTLNAELIPVDYPTAKVKVWDVYYDGFENSRIHGRYILPEGIAKGTKIPAIIIHHGYNWNNFQISMALKYTLLGYAVFLAEARGQNLHSPDHNLYVNGGACGWMTLGILDPMNYYYRYVFMDCARIVDFLLDREEIDSDRIAIEGSSQGGGVALAVGALCPEIKVVMSDIPFLCHYRRAVELAQTNPYLEIADFFRIQDSLHKMEEQVYGTLSYFDNLNLAPKIKGDVLMSIDLEDVTCTPSTGFAVYNHICAYKELRVYSDFGHVAVTQHDEEKFAFLVKRFS